MSAVLSVKDLHVSSSTPEGPCARSTRVVRRRSGECVGIVGESGIGQEPDLHGGDGTAGHERQGVTGSAGFKDHSSSAEDRQLNKIRGSKIAHDLPGSDDVADAASEDRPAAHRGPGAAQRHERARRAQRALADARSGEDSRRQAAHRSNIRTNSRAACASA